MRRTICVDLDGVLADYSKGWQGVDVIGDPIPGAVEFTHQLSKFADVLIFTARYSPFFSGDNAEQIIRPLRRWLKKHGFAYKAIYTGKGKPIASAYVDDRAVQCLPQQHGFGPALEACRNLTGEE